jgi:hypothetical protein
LGLWEFLQISQVYRNLHQSCYLKLQTTVLIRFHWIQQHRDCSADNRFFEKVWIRGPVYLSLKPFEIPSNNSAATSWSG